jgi:hypothetical protein
MEYEYRKYYQQQPQAFAEYELQQTQEEINAA